MEFIKNNLLIVGIITVVILYLVFFTNIIFKNLPKINLARSKANTRILANQAQLRLRQGTSSTAFKFGKHNIPHPDDQDGAIYRSDGQVQIAADDLIRFRHIISKQTGVQMDVRPGHGDLSNPNGMTKITRQGIMFGGPNNVSKEVNSAQISAGRHIPNSLNIVGMSSNKSAGTRRVDVWAENGMHVRSNQGLKVHGHGRETSYGSVNGGWSHMITNAPQFYMNKSLQVNGGVSSYYNKPLLMPHGASVRGNLCIGNTCINENQLQSLIGRRPITLRAGVSGRRLQNAVNENNNGRFTNANRGTWEQLFIEPL